MCNNNININILKYLKQNKILPCLEILKLAHRTIIKHSSVHASVSHTYYVQDTLQGVSCHFFSVLLKVAYLLSTSSLRLESVFSCCFLGIVFLYGEMGCNPQEVSSTPAVKCYLPCCGSYLYVMQNRIAQCKDLFQRMFQKQ